MSVGLPGGDNFEPMQVDPEENDNDEGAGMGPDVRLVHQVDHVMAPMIGGGIGVNGGPIAGAANGSPGIMRGGGAGLGGVSAAGALPHGDLHGEDVRVFYNIENPSIDLETYVQGRIRKCTIIISNDIFFDERLVFTVGHLA